jgi:hypothetical protein
MRSSRFAFLISIPASCYRVIVDAPTCLHEQCQAETRVLALHRESWRDMAHRP